MVYYKVNGKHDREIRHGQEYWYLIAGELYTEKELKRFGKLPESWFTKINIPTSQVYWNFGARFQIA